MDTDGLMAPTPELIPATRDQEGTLANLLELYAYDFSEFVHLPIGPDGRFHYPELSRYWREETRFPFLVKVQGHLAGLVLVSRGSRISGHPLVWDMAEFFVMRGYRRQGVGATLALEVFRRFPGAWEVRVRESNAPALAFWTATIDAYTGMNREVFSVEEGGASRRVFAFVSPTEAVE